MAKIYYLTKEQILNGKRSKTPRQKQRMWSQVCLVLSIAIVLEHVALAYFWWH